MTKTQSVIHFTFRYWSVFLTPIPPLPTSPVDRDTLTTFYYASSLSLIDRDDVRSCRADRSFCFQVMYIILRFYYLFFFVILLFFFFGGRPFYTSFVVDSVSRYYLLRYHRLHKDETRMLLFPVSFTYRKVVDNYVKTKSMCLPVIVPCTRPMTFKKRKIT